MFMEIFKFCFMGGAGVLFQLRQVVNKAGIKPRLFHGNS
jgi:hypothetical protein